MREQALIVLNEREPAKQRAAAALLEALSMRKRSASRLRPGPRLAELLIERRPGVIILDYLLGDEGTALDVLSELRATPDGAALPVIIWTDDPSVSAAVGAMKFGAVDYVELDGARNFERLLRSIDQVLTDSQKPFRSRLLRYESSRSAAGGDLIAESPAMRQALAELRTIITSGAQSLILLGPPGSGRSAVAQYLHYHRTGSGVLLERPLELWDGTPEDVFSGRAHRPPLLSSGATVVLEHAEFDDAGRLCSLAHRSLDSREPGTLCVIGTSDERTAELWHRACDIPVTVLPRLSERREDILPLLHRWLAEAKATGLSTRWSASRAAADLMNSEEWPHQIRQLRRCVFDAFGSMMDTAPLPDLSLPSEIADLDERDRRFFHALFLAKQRFERYSNLAPVPPSRAAARREISRSKGDELIAAVRLGVGIPQLRAALGIQLFEEPREEGAPL